MEHTMITASCKFHEQDLTDVHGREGTDLPYPVSYHGDGLPAEGIDPHELPEWESG
jgi:hypothetical protein